MPRRDYDFTAKLGTAPTNGWVMGTAVKITSSDANGTPVVTAATKVENTAIFGWTSRNGVVGDYVGIRTIFEGTIMARLATSLGTINSGTDLWITTNGELTTTDPADGTMPTAKTVNYTPSGVRFAEVYVLSHKIYVELTS